MNGLRFRQLLLVAARNFLRSRLHSVLLIIAAATGSGGVIASAGYAAAGREKIIQQFASLGTNVIIVTPTESRSVGNRARTGSLVTTLNDADYQAIKQAVSPIRQSSPTILSVQRIRAGDLTKNTTIVGCDPEYFKIKHWKLSQGDAFQDDSNRRQTRVAVLGAIAATDLFGDDDPTGRTIIVGKIPFVVTGVLSERGQGLDAANEDEQVFVPIDTMARRLLNISYFASIVFEIQDRSQMDDAQAQIESVLRRRHRPIVPEQFDFQIQNQKRLIDTQFITFARVTFFMRWIALSALGVSSLGVFAITWISVRNRNKEIGTRRAIGATRLDVILQILSEGGLGAFLGSSLGVAMAYLVLRFIDARVIQPFVFNWKSALSDNLLSISLYSVFTFCAGIRAILILPVVALRSE